MSFRWSILWIGTALLMIVGCRSAEKIPVEQADIPSAHPILDLASHAAPSSAENRTETVGFDDSTPDSHPAIESIGQARSLSLADLEGIAFQSNPTLAAASARIRAARGRQLQAGLYPNPVIGYHGTEIGNRGTSGQQGGFVSQRFITAGKLRLDQEIAGKEIDEARFRLLAQEQRVLSDVRARFYEALVAQKRVKLTEKLLRIGENLAKATDTLLKGRQATENDLLQAQIRAENARILHENATNESVEAWRRLAAVVGLPRMELKQLNEDPGSQLPDFNWDACYQKILASHPEVSAARARAERARIAITRAKREPVPNVDVSVSIRHIDLTDSDVANVQVGVPIPIFDKNQGNVRSAEAEWEAASREVERVILALQDRFAVTFRRYANARQQVERYGDKIVPKAERSLELVTRGYEKGQVEYLTLLTAQQTLIEVSLSQLDAVRELRVAAAILEGKLLTGSLDSPR